jgi:hypothetical protein
MSSDIRDDVVLRRYLLGNVTPDVRERIEGRLFSDDEAFWEHLCLVEDELIESYVARELRSEDVDRFEKSFLCTDERRSKLEFAVALKAYVETRRSQPAPATLWQRLQRMVPIPGWAVAAAVAALLLLPIAGGLVGRTMNRSVPGATDVTASVSTGLVRGAAAELPRVQLSSDCKLLRLAVEPDEKHALYAATLHEVSGEEILTQNNLTTSDVDGRTVVTLTLPCEILPGGDYYVTLRAATSPNAAAVAAAATGSRASFRVLRP